MIAAARESRQLNITVSSPCVTNAMLIYKEFTIEAAHRLPNVPDGHKCARLHGHSFVIRVEVEGGVCDQAGWVMDFSDIKLAFEPLFEQLDHNYLNDIKAVSYTHLTLPTSPKV